MTYILALEIGTTHMSTALFDTAGKPFGFAQRELAHFYSKPERIGQNPEHIYRMAEDCIMETVQSSGVTKSQITAIGMAKSDDYGDEFLTDLNLGCPIMSKTSIQQASLVGHKCFQTGMAKVTFGVGSIVVLNVGQVDSPAPEGIEKRLAWSIDGVLTYALEGNILCSGSALEWLRDALGFIQSFDELEPLVKSVENSLGVYFVPALSGLGAPSWDSKARGLFIGLTRGTQRAHMVRAVLEALAFQVKEVLDAMGLDHMTLINISVEGSPARNDFLVQTLADACQINVKRVADNHATLTGAAYLAGLEAGIWQSLDDVNRLDSQYQLFQPQKDLTAEYTKWQEAVKRAYEWAE